MGDETERDGLDEIRDPALLRILLRQERGDSDEREAEEQAAKESLRAEIRRLRGEATPSTPALVHPEDLKRLRLDDRVEMDRKILRGELRVTPEAPRSPPRRLTREQLSRLSFEERHQFDLQWLRGEAELIE